MAVNKAITASGFNRTGRSFGRSPNKSYWLDRTNTPGIVDDPNFSPSGGIFAPAHDSGRSWATTGYLVDSTGTILFNNDTNGGYLSSIIVANRGGTTAYVGFNSERPITGSGFPLASGESMQHQGVITEVWAIADSGATARVAAQGIFGFNSPIF